MPVIVISKKTFDMIMSLLPLLPEWEMDIDKIVREGVMSLRRKMIKQPS